MPYVSVLTMWLGNMRRVCMKYCHLGCIFLTLQHGKTALHRAVEKGHKRVVELLLANGAGTKDIRSRVR